MAKIINYNTEFHNKILSGIEKAEKCVCSTLGPSGRPVLINDGRQTRLTKDGISVFQSIELEDPIENSAVIALREASAKVAKDAGDGTTTVTSLGSAIYRNGLKYTTMNVNPVQVKNGIDKASEKVIEFIQGQAKKISTKDDIKKVCLISSNGDEKVSDVISEVFSKLGTDATIQIEDSGTEIGYKIVDGFQLPNTGYLSPFFCTSEDMTCNMKDAMVMVLDGKITNVNEILPTLQSIIQAHVPLLIVAESIETEVMSTLIMNRLNPQVGLQVCCVRAPSYGENRKAIFRDIAMLCNGKVISDETGVLIKDAVLGGTVLGLAKSVVVTKDTTTIVGSAKQEDMDSYVATLKTHIENTTDEFDKKKMQERYARLTNGIGKINIFAPTEIELKELRDRVDDAFCAAKSALKEGIVPGGGTSLLKAKKSLEEWLKTQNMTDDEMIGAKILCTSLEAPIRNILENAGIDSSIVVGKILEFETENIGYDVVSKKYVDMIENGIIDPCQVECSAVQNAVSVAGLLLTSSSCIVQKPEDNKCGRNNMSMM